MPVVQVLIIDDEKHDVELTQSMFDSIRETRYEVRWASDFEQGLQEISTRKYDVCLLDQNIGPRSGLELMRTVGTAGGRLQFIFLTGAENRSLVEEALAAGASDYLVKGQITPVLLDRSIRYALGRRQAEEARLESQQRLDLALESAQIGAWELDLVNDVSTRSLRHDQIFGYDTLQPKWGMDTFMSHVLPEDRGLVQDSFARAFVTDVFSLQCRIHRPDRSLHWIDTQGRIYRTPEGKPVKMLGVISDITTRMLAQEALKRAQDAAERAMRARAEFLANMSHEIRTPMNGVIGMTSILLETPMTTAQREYVEIIRVSGETLLVLINDILDFSKIESGRLELEQQEFDLTACIEESLMLFRAKAYEKGIELMYLFQPSVPHTVIGDVTRLRQIITNLVSNAVKFTHQGEVEIAVDALPPNGGDETRRTLAIRVRDTGIGIPPDKRHRLFQDFSQVNSSTTRQFGGTGLGLAISRRLAGLMGGAMDVESEPGEGSTFYFTVEVGVTATKRTLLPNTPIPSLAQRKLLVVDDNATNRRILRLYVEGWGAECFEAPGAQEALRLLDSETGFHACLVDYQMPDCDGLKLAAMIRARHPPKTLPIIMLTSASREGLRTTAKQLGLSQILDKPVKPSVLYDALVEALSQLDAAKPGPNAALSSTEEIASGHPFSILVAEDNSVNQMVARLMLEKLGYRADLVANGQEAIEACAQRGYDILFMDIQMPVLDGIEATQRLRRRTDLRQPWIIAMTANAMSGDRERFLDAGMDDYVSKPVKLSDVRDALLQAWSRRQAKLAL